MITLAENDKKRLDELGVGIVYLFGSCVSGLAREDSDYDVGVVFADRQVAEKEQIKLHSILYDIFSEYIPDLQNGSRPDISFLQFSNAGLEMSAIDGVCIFQKDPVSRADYEESVFHRYDDYSHIRETYQEATIAAFCGGVLK